jgi:metallo-beta-lactamase family protein
MNLQFLGAAGTVTGSRFLLDAGGRRILVDCGLFQGLKQLRLRNWRPFPVAPGSIDDVVLTHAHLDHSGYLPALVRDGFQGRIHCNAPTADLAAILLRDAGFLQEEDANYARRKGFSKHDPPKPLYTVEDAERAIERLQPLRGTAFELGPIHGRLIPAGHILGATSVRLEHKGHSVLFSGDLGREDDLLIPPPARNPGADTVVMESTYGDRRHGTEDVLETLAGIVRRTIERGGLLLVAAFAVGRAQAVMWAIHQLREQGRIPAVPVYLNSPMADAVTHLYDDHVAWHRLSLDQCHDLFRSARFVRSVEESKALNTRQEPMIVISASGMLTGGRVVHHLAAWAGDARNTILLPGFQAAGTRGAHLAGGADQVKVHGRYIAVRAEVVKLDGFSAHADADELLAWLKSAEQRPDKVWLVHGEPSASDALRLRIQDELGIAAEVAEDRGESAV